MQEEPSSLQEPAHVMHIQILNQVNPNLPMKIPGINVLILYDAGTNMSCMSYLCYMKLKDMPSLKMIPSLSVHSSTGHDLCPIGLTCCEDRIGKSQFRHTFIVCKKFQKEIVIGLDMQQSHHLGCDWTNDKCFYTK